LLTRGVHSLTLPFTLKSIKAKEELWKFKYFTMQKYNLQKNPLKETKILQDITTLHNTLALVGKANKVMKRSTLSFSETQD